MKTTLPLARAQQLAAALVADLAGGCSTITIAGSVRRRKPTVGDIELVVVPIPILDLVGSPTDRTRLESFLERLVERGDLATNKGGRKFIQFSLPAHGCNLDLFLANKDNYGLILLIRTGPVDFSKRFVTQKHKGGLLPNDLRIEGGRLLRGDTVLPTPTEAEVFRLAGVEYAEPWER